MDKDLRKKLITFYIGTFDKDTRKQELSINYFKQELDKLFNCYTLSKCYGRYKHNDGTTVNELTLKVEYVDLDNILNVQKNVRYHETKIQPRMYNGNLYGNQCSVYIN